MRGNKIFMTTELMECYFKSMSENGGFLKRMSSQKDDPGPTRKTVTIYHI